MQCAKETDEAAEYLYLEYLYLKMFQDITASFKETSGSFVQKCLILFVL